MSEKKSDNSAEEKLFVVVRPSHKSIPFGSTGSEPNSSESAPQPLVRPAEGTQNASATAPIDTD